MRLYTFRTPDRPPAPAGGDPSYDVMEVGADWTPRDIAAQPRQPGPAIQASGKVVCIGLNYRDHLEEQHLPMPDRPMLFGKWRNAVIADGEPIVRPEGCHALDAEVELGVVIGRRARRVSSDEAMAHVALMMPDALDRPGPGYDTQARRLVPTDGLQEVRRPNRKGARLAGSA